MCVYVYVSEYAVHHFTPAITGRDQLLFSLIIASMSAFSIFMFAAMAYAREKADEKLFALVSETEELAATDGLTGLMNRRAFMDNLRALWPNRDKICIVFIDLDHFKPLNDQYGHAVGDQVLCKVAQRIGDVPHVQMTARLGGDEFAVLFDEQACDDTTQHQIETLHAHITQDMR